MPEGQTVVSDPVATDVAAPEGQAADVVAGTPEISNGQAAPTQAQGATSEDNFTSIDPKTLPPELQAIHKSMLGDYTKKTMAIAEKEKQLGDASKKAELYDQISRDQNFVKYWQGLSRQEKTEFKDQKAQVEKSLGEKITDAEFAKAFDSKQDFLQLLERVVEDKRAGDQKEIQELKTKNSINEAANIIDSVATEVGKDGQALRPDFYALDEDNLITGYLKVNPSNDPEQYQENVMSAYAWAKSVANKYREAGKAEALKIIQTKAQNSTEMPTQSAKGIYSGKDPRTLDVSEAVAMARRGERVPQNY